MSTPYWASDDGCLTLYLGDCRDILAGGLPEQPAACVTDPPYGETVAAWDRWPAGWVQAVAAVLPASAPLWCFGTARMFLEHVGDFTGWRYGQEALWLKHNGSSPGSRDRLLKVHEWAYHWYRGRWSDMHHEWEREPAQHGDKGTVRKPARAAAHQRGSRQTAWQDDGLRQPRSVRVLVAPSVRYQQRHQDEKPLSIVAELVRECTPPGGLVLDPMVGSGTTLEAARLTGRRGIAIEADERIAETAAKRLSQLALEPLGDVHA
jgi:site-specific DNA-methyltransferase (adenine-specific)